MRCLTLADRLSARGYLCHFLTRANSGNLQDRVVDRGHELHVLPQGRTPDYGAHPNPPQHAAWLGAAWQEDAADSARILTRVRPDWLILDHYALDAAWERHALPKNTDLAVIDDLADRPHLASLLLDQNLGHRERDYSSLLPADCRLLIGPQYALLRPEFAKKRSEAQKRRKTPDQKHLLITLGGVDKNNATGAMLSALSQLPLPKQFRITVVMTRQAPFLADVQRQAATMPCPTAVVLDATDMASLMVDADFCIGAAGSTIWEFCCLGLPAFLVILAANQMGAARAMAKAGAAVLLGEMARNEWKSQLAEAMVTLTTSKLASLSRNAFGLTDGTGCEKFAAILQEGCNHDVL